MSNDGFGWLLFSFDGRINRGRFWTGYVLVIAMIALAGAVGISVNSNTSYVIYALVFLLAFWPSLALYVKRFHDRGKSGWWVLISLIPVVGAIWMFVELGCLPGDNGVNEYGANPLLTAA